MSDRIPGVADPRPILAEQVNVADTLSGQPYNDERLRPEPGQVDYLHLCDLREALAPFATDEPLRILDFGCGGSPYRSLFPNADYRRADFTVMEGLDYRVDGDSRVEAPTGEFDLVLSTQVLEHVSDPANYLAEALRVLKPRGRLILTTHGVYPDHGCPHDFWRWTGEGLRREVAAAGFETHQVQQLTCDARAVHYLWDMYAQSGLAAGTGFLPQAVRRIYRQYLRNLAHRMSDRLFATSRIRSGETAREGSLYIALLIAAVKP